MRNNVYPIYIKQNRRSEKQKITSGITAADISTALNHIEGLVNTLERNNELIPIGTGFMLTVSGPVYSDGAIRYIVNIRIDGNALNVLKNTGKVTIHAFNPVSDGSLYTPDNITFTGNIPAISRTAITYYDGVFANYAYNQPHQTHEINENDAGNTLDIINYATRAVSAGTFYYLSTSSIHGITGIYQTLRTIFNASPYFSVELAAGEKVLNRYAGKLTINMTDTAKSLIGELKTINISYIM